MTTPQSRPGAVGRIAATIPVADLERAIDFYASWLGLEPTFRNGQPAGFAILRSGSTELHLTRVAEHCPASHNVAHVLVHDAEALCNALDTAGIRIVKGLRDADYGVRGFVFADPDGNRIDVGQILSKRSRQ